MWLVRFLGKILLMPVLLVVGLLRFAVNIATKVYSFITVCFWALLAIITVMTLCYHKYDQTIIMLVLAAISFLILFGGVWLLVMLEDMGEWIKKKVFF